MNAASVIAHIFCSSRDRIQTLRHGSQRDRETDDELARKHVETHDPKIREEIYRLGRELEEMEEVRKAVKSRASVWRLFFLRRDHGR
jgi:hypothetical protein